MNASDSPGTRAWETGIGSISTSLLRSTAIFFAVLVVEWATAGSTVSQTRQLPHDSRTSDSLNSNAIPTFFRMLKTDCYASTATMIEHDGGTNRIDLHSDVIQFRGSPVFYESSLNAASFPSSLTSTPPSTVGAWLPVKVKTSTDPADETFETYSLPLYLP